MVVVVTLNCDLCIKILCCKYNHRRLLRQFVIIKTLIKTYMLVWVCFFFHQSDQRVNVNILPDVRGAHYFSVVTSLIIAGFPGFHSLCSCLILWRATGVMQHFLHSLFYKSDFFNQFIYDGLKGISGTLQPKTSLRSSFGEKINSKKMHTAEHCIVHTDCHSNILVQT